MKEKKKISPRTDVLLKHFSTFHVGGRAEYFVEAFSKEEVREALLWAKAQGCAWRVIGSGSNILFADEMVSGLTIQNRIEGIEHEVCEEGVRLTAGAGVILDDLVFYACEGGWWGMENLSAIPGTVGATPVQNVGAYGVEVAQKISSIDAYDIIDDAYVTLEPRECAFGYRDSLFKQNPQRYVILAVCFTLSKQHASYIEYRDLQEYFKENDSAALTPNMVRAAVTAIRSKKFPDWKKIGTLGSFFKNPIISRAHYELLREKYPLMPVYDNGAAGVKIPLGWVLDHVCGVRGKREGDVATYDAQALVIVNYGNATAEETLAFADSIMRTVKEKTEIDIEKEITFVK